MTQVNNQDQDPEEEEEASFARAQSLSHGWTREAPMVHVWL